MAAVDTKTEQQAKLREILEKGGVRGVIGHIQGLPSPEERRALYSMARQAFPERSAGGRSFDDLILLANTGIEDALRQAENARAKGETDLAAKCLDAANMLAYNLAADLCECWPEDAAPRERRHLETGLRVASQAVVWRHELGKPPDRRAMAYWAVGMHHLSLGNRVEALGAWETALKLAAEAVAHGKGALDPLAHVKAGADFGLVLYAGYAGIARKALGDPAGAKQYEKACAAFTETAAKFPDQKEDATFGLDQLRWVQKKFAARG